MRKKVSAFGLIVITILLTHQSLLAGDIDKAFKYLNTGDYPNAYRFLREAFTEEPDNPAVNYGMAKYFSMKDNKSYNLDSANFYILRAVKKLPLNPDDKETKRLLNLGVRDYTIQSLQKTINFEAYQDAERKNTLESYQHFLDVFTDSVMREQAINFRNQKAYMRALSLKSVQALDEFIKKYPQAEQVKEAKERYEKMLYEQTTADGTFQSYKKYLDNYPNGAYMKQAKQEYEERLLNYYLAKKDLKAYVEFVELYKDHPAHGSMQDSIYRIVTNPGTVKAFAEFIRAYPKNRNADKAWEQLYILYTALATEDVYNQFLKEFPDYKNTARVNADRELARKVLYPFKVGDKWGYGPDSLNLVIPAQYAEAYPFSCGFAAVRSAECTSDACVYYYINKNNERAFTTDFNYAADFAGGYAIVGTGKCEIDECMYGMIDKRGTYVLKPEFEEIADLSEGLYAASKGKKYGYINQQGDEVITFKYDDALPFSQGVAAVAISGNWFFIDKTGAQKFINRFMDVSSFSDSLCAVTQDGENWGYVDMSGNFVIQPQFETAEDFVAGFAIVSKREKDPKNKSLTISQRYRIDKTGKILEKLTAPKTTVSKGKKRRSR